MDRKSRVSKDRQAVRQEDKTRERRVRGCLERQEEMIRGALKTRPVERRQWSRLEMEKRRDEGRKVKRWKKGKIESWEKEKERDWGDRARREDRARDKKRRWKVERRKEES